MTESIGDLVRRMERDYTSGTTQTSKWVSYSMYDTINKIDAYLNSKHISGPEDKLGRKKPFFNISTALANVWFRATDIDRSAIKIRSTKSTQWLASFAATALLQRWMRTENFGMFLNEWGRVLSRYGSAVVKFVNNSSGLHISVVPWQMLIVDPVDFYPNPKIEILELTEGQLRERVATHGYDKDKVESLLYARSERKTLGGNTKDTKSDYVRLYEVHLVASKEELTEKESDEDTFVQQMWVLSFVADKSGERGKFDDFYLFKGEEKEDPYMITHLIPEDGRTLARGPIEQAFEAQWMVNHEAKLVKDTLDLANRLVYQTADQGFLNMNVLSGIETGGILVTQSPLTKVDTSKPDIVSAQNFAMQWKQLSQEINGVSEAMLGATPKSGTAWRQTEALLTESHNLFEVMTQNKHLYAEEMLRRRIVPWIKTQLDTTEEVVAILSSSGIQEFDSQFVPIEAVKRYNKRTSKLMFDNIDQLVSGNTIASPIQPFDQQQETQAVMQSLSQFGNRRFIKPSDLDNVSWKEVFKDFEWEFEYDAGGETRNIQEALSTLNTALKMVLTPGFEQNKRAQAIVGRVLEFTGAMSPVEFSALPSGPAPAMSGAAPTPDMALIGNGAAQ